MIKCPTCGTSAPDSAATCAVCARPLRKPTVATAVLTPPVPSSISAADAETIAVSHVIPLTGVRTASSLVPGQTFGHRYQVISVLGVGGMGAVYHVWDSELGLSLALKVIKPETDPGAAQELERRFKRELVLARQVTHTNVIRIHDLGEIDGTKYITMPFVQGSDLAKVLAHEGKLPLARALPLARQVVSGLRAAHEVGIVHRDLKPANILIDESEKAIITDFGIARSTDAGTFATAAGAIIGTLAYMAPEQASGRPVDQRADIYAFGLILSEMLTGRRGTVGGDTALAQLIERSRQAPPPLRTIDASIPEPIERIVSKCLEPDPNARYQTTKDLEADLDRLDANGFEKTQPQAHAQEAKKRLSPIALAGLGLAVAAVLLIGAWIAQTFMSPPSGVSAPAAARAPLSVLIADFDNQAKDPVFTESLEQALSIAMEGASFITSHPRTSAKSVMAGLKLEGPLNESNARLVAASEGIKVVLTGSVAAEGGGYLIKVRAIDPSPNGAQLGAAEARVNDKGGVLKGVETVASTLREQLGDTTPESVRRAAGETVTTVSLDALQEYSIAQDLSSSGRQVDSIKHYQNAIDLDENFGRAYSGLATVLFNTGQADKAAELWQQSLTMMDRMSEREQYRTRGLWFAGPGGDYDKAIEDFEKLVAAYPSDRAGLSNLAFSYFQTLDFAKAMDVGLKAVNLYPKNPRTRANYAIYATYAGDLKTAEREALKVLEDSKTQYKAYLPLVAIAFVASDTAKMREGYESMRTTGAAGASLATHGLADLAMYEGRWGDAEKLLADGIAADEKTKNTAGKAQKLVMLAELHLAMNRTAQATQAAKDALALTKDNATVVPAALVLVRSGQRSQAEAIAKDLSKGFQRRSRAYGAIVEGELARASGRFLDAADAFNRARGLADLWLVRMLLGRTYVEADKYLEAQPELTQVDKRRVEASAVFLDDLPTYRHLAPMLYWLGRMQEGLNKSSPAAAENYAKFLTLRPDAARDPLALDARKRIAK
jgi:tetratricopeptide (TPR) repeat protein